MADPRDSEARRGRTDDPARYGVPYPGGMGEQDAVSTDNEYPPSAPNYGVEGMGSKTPSDWGVSKGYSGDPKNYRR
jgi:hypothetical protein